MRITQNLALIGALVATGAQATVHVVKAVANPFSFLPDTVNAKVGDYIEFHFLPANHSVAKGTFKRACEPAHEYGFFSGFLPVAEGESDKVFKILVENEDPFVFYCTQGQHCASGMYGVVNPTEKKSKAAYGALVSVLEDKKAKQPSKTTPFGGALIDNPNLSKPNETETETGSENSAVPSQTRTQTGIQTQTQPAVIGVPSPTFIEINPQVTDGVVGVPQATGGAVTPGPVQASGSAIGASVALMFGAVGFAALMI